MNVYIWQRVLQASSCYHTGGGVVVLAGSLERAREIANAEPGCAITPEEQPDEVHTLAESIVPERVFIMPDAGCC